MTGYTYVASSWRNEHYPAVIERLKAEGLTHYDFRNPAGGTGFAWSEVDPNWQAWSAKQYIELLKHPIAEAGFQSDFQAMQRADAFVLVLPCGRSAHLELGWAAGQGKRTAILTRDGEEPELMAKMVDLITDDLDEIVRWLHGNPLTAGNVHGVVRSCMYTDAEISADARAARRAPDGATVVEGITHRFVFDPARVDRARPDIRAMLTELPRSFKASAREEGGGWSFLNLCIRADGHQWTGLHTIQEGLCALAIAAGYGRWSLPREMWPALPGSMPYFTVLDADW